MGGLEKRGRVRQRAGVRTAHDDTARLVQRVSRDAVLGTALRGRVAWHSSDRFSGTVRARAALSLTERGLAVLISCSH